MKSSSTKTTQSRTPKPDGLETPVQFCPGVGPSRAKTLEKMGIYSVRDLFWHLPRGYEDFHFVTPIAHLPPNAVATVKATVTYAESRAPRRSRVRHILNATVKDDSGELEVVWFNQSYLSNQIKPGIHLRLHGKAEGRAPFMKMSSPKFTIIGEEEEDEPGDILPLYPLAEKLTQAALRKITAKAMERFSSYLVEWLSEAVLNQFNFPTRKEAFRILHAPQAGEGAPVDSALPEDALLFNLSELDDDEPSSSLPEGTQNSPWENARRRLVFEEFYLHQLSLRLVQGRLKQHIGVAHPAPVPDPLSQQFDETENLSADDPAAWPARFLRDLPFTMTEEQLKACREIQADMMKPAPMNRLLQGDVGSGKTVVSIYAMLLAAAGGCQAALMAPTELLAQQHAASIRAFTKTIPQIQTIVLTGGMKASEKRDAQLALKTGVAQLVVGTHALFQEDVEFERLGLVVVDEQHKFGVEQRERLVQKGEHPDLLAATATPIPRTLSLTVYGDMDISTIATLPPNRPEIRTRWTHWHKESKVWGFVDEKLAQGQQAYVVCPIIDPSETQPELPSTEEAFEKITEQYLPNRRVALLHGRHSPQDKQAMMDAIRAGDIDAVVATTVIEVGVDLPNATIMVILGAERFGLAQLHQLRGRVGRGTLKSYCILITPEKLSPYAEQRMLLMEKTRDGFRIAEEDLKLRGPGEAFGTRQSGRIHFHLADPLRDGELLQSAHQSAQALYESDPKLESHESANLKREIQLAYGRIALRRPS